MTNAPSRSRNNGVKLVIATLKIAVILFAVALIYEAVTNYRKGAEQAEQKHAFYKPTPVLPNDPNFPQSNATATSSETAVTPNPNVASFADDEVYLRDTGVLMSDFVDALEELRVTSFDTDFSDPAWCKRLNHRLEDLNYVGYDLAKIPHQMDDEHELDLSPSVERLRHSRHALGQEILRLEYDVREQVPDLSSGQGIPKHRDKFVAAWNRLKTIVVLLRDTKFAYREARKNFKESHPNTSSSISLD